MQGGLQGAYESAEAKNFFGDGELVALPGDLPPVSASYHKFMELDVNKSGELDIHELHALAVWVYESFQKVASNACVLGWPWAWACAQCQCWREEAVCC